VRRTVWFVWYGALAEPVAPRAKSSCGVFTTEARRIQCPGELPIRTKARNRGPIFDGGDPLLSFCKLFDFSDRQPSRRCTMNIRTGDLLSLSDRGLYGRFPFRTPCVLRGAILLLRRDRTMIGGKNPAADKALQKLVDRRLQQSGGSQLGLKAVVVNGSVTITGKLKYDNQRIPLMKSMRGVPGVRNIQDQLQSPPKVVPGRPAQGGA
jgi:hypothetical protein